MKKIAFVSYKYNWESFGIIKSMYETLLNFGYDVKWFEVSYTNNIRWEPDQIWCAGVYTESPNEKKTFVVKFGFSDPNLFNDEKSKECNIYVTNDLLTHRRLQKSIYFPCFCDIRYHRKIDCARSNHALFIGTRAHEYIPWRLQAIKKIRNAGIKIIVYGDNWPAHPDNNPFIKGDDMIYAINHAALCVDLATEISSLGHRIFESSACGTPIITRRREDVLSLFKEDDEIICYDSINEMIDKIKYWLLHQEGLKKIGEKAKDRCIKEHDISHRLSELLQKLEEPYKIWLASSF